MKRSAVFQFSGTLLSKIASLHLAYICYHEQVQSCHKVQQLSLS